MLLAELHIAEKCIVNPLITTTEEMIENFLPCLIILTLVSIVTSLQQIRTEHTITFHSRSIELAQILSLRSLAQIGTSAIGVEHIGKLGCLAWIFNTGLIKIGQSSTLIAELLCHQSLHHECRSSFRWVLLHIVVKCTISLSKLGVHVCRMRIERVRQGQFGLAVDGHLALHLLLSRTLNNESHRLQQLCLSVIGVFLQDAARVSQCLIRATTVKVKIGSIFFHT